MANKPLVIKWSKREDDFAVKYPNLNGGKLGYALMISLYRGLDVIYQKKLIAMLDEMGYDYTTLKITIKRKSEAQND